jgi:NADH-quinone oxidoreductase subunit C
MQDLYNLISKKILNLQLSDIKIIQHQFLELHLDKLQLADCVDLLGTPDLGFNILSDCFAADFPDREKRFEIVYNFFSLRLNDRVLIKISLSDSESVPSIASLHNSANWYEREIYDLFGIEFENHPDLRRLLTDYGFIGHPLRKDFPLTGYLQARYDETLEKVIYEPVKLDQKYRYFNTISPWQKNPIINKKS